MPKIKSTNLSLQVDGKTIEIKNEKKGNKELNAALSNPGGVKSFAKDPAAFASQYGLSIDNDIAQQLSKRLGNAASIADVRSIIDDGGTQATAWAVAEGVYSIASTKIAVAF